MTQYQNVHEYVLLVLYFLNPCSHFFNQSQIHCIPFSCFFQGRALVSRHVDRQLGTRIRDACSWLYARVLKPDSCRSQPIDSPHAHHWMLEDLRHLSRLSSRVHAWVAAVWAEKYIMASSDDTSPKISPVQTQPDEMEENTMYDSSVNNRSYDAFAWEAYLISKLT